MSDELELIAELVKALREAITELDNWCKEIDGEGFNRPSWNALIERAEGRS